MNVVKASHAGACYGVQRALKIAYEVLGEVGDASTLGPLIHNPQVVAELESKGLSVAEAPEDVPSDTVIVRSHGVTPQVCAALEEAGRRVVDATCPHVALAQQGAAELAEAGCRVLVVGEAGHPEVESLVAYAGGNGAKVDVVKTAADVPGDLYAPVGVVVQTTQTRDNLDAVLEELASRGFEPMLKDTICSATQRRQKSAAELACQVDAMVVIGGRNSSNTTRLAEICVGSCPRCFHVESPDELVAADFEGCATVGVTAGASTPKEQIDDVVAFLESL